MGNQFLKQILTIWRKFSFLHKALIFSSCGAFLLFLALPKAEKEEKSVVQKVAPVGFELFDGGTWIKGEKELQMLELRALKGQLESEIEKFENVEEASVILDFGQTRPLGGVVAKPKASALLQLVPGTFLSQSTLWAITSHLVGGVRNLESADVAISDTTGRVYKALGEDPKVAKMIRDEKLKSDLSLMLCKIVGPSHFHLALDENRLSIILDQEASGSNSVKEIAKSCAHLVGADVAVSIEKVSFAKKKIPQVTTEEKKNYLYYCPLLLLFFLPFLLRKKKKRSEKEIVQMIQGIDVERLIDSIKREEPHTIALLLSYLDTGRAEKVIKALPPETQEEVFAHLTDLESGNE